MHLKVDRRGEEHFFFNPKGLQLPGKHFLLRSFSHLSSFFLCRAFAVISDIMFLMESLPVSQPVLCFCDPILFYTQFCCCVLFF